jgi:ABC-2 type transport system ATP-binding protein
VDAILLESVCKSFGRVRAVDNLTVRVPAGCVYGFLGPNGAGKTTTIRMITNIIHPDSGCIKIFGNGTTNLHGTSSVGHFSRAHSIGSIRIGYMPEERGLYRKMKVSKVLAYFGAIKGLKKGQINSRVRYWLEQMDLANWADKKVEELSRGMHQKLQFAVTVIDDPELVILDEPFSGLDPVNQDLLKDIICRMRSAGKTVLFSTHVMHEAEQLCDYILLINKGKTVLDGRLDEIRSCYKSGAVSVEFGGELGPEDASFVKTLPMVKVTESQGRRMEISLSADADPQDLLKALVGRVRVQAFEVKVPSLHEIFISLVARPEQGRSGKEDAKDS